MTDGNGAMYGDDVYTEGVEDATDFDPAANLTGDDLEEPFDSGYSPPDYEPKATRYGTTAFEQEQGESLAQRLAQEEADLDPEAATDDSADPRAGRLIVPDEGVHPDHESEVFAFDVGRAGSAASAEEAAMHVVDEDAVDIALIEEDTDS